MVPLEADRPLGAEPRPVLVVPPGRPVELRGRGQREHPGAEGNRQGSGAAAGLQPRGPEPGDGEHQQDDPPERLRPGVVERGSDPVGDQQHGERRRPRRAATPNRPEGDRPREGDQRRGAEDQCQSDPRVGPGVGQLGLLDPAHAALDLRPQLTPLRRREQVRRQAGGDQCPDHGRERDRDAEGPASASRPDPGGQLKRDRPGGDHQQCQRLAVGRRGLDQTRPQRHRERRDEREQAEFDRERKRALGDRGSGSPTPGESRRPGFEANRSAAQATRSSGLVERAPTRRPSQPETSSAGEPRPLTPGPTR